MVRVVKQLKGIVSKQIGTSIWQKSFHDHIIRNRVDYEEHLRYRYENPMRWCYDELYTEGSGEGLCLTPCYIKMP